MTNPNKFDIEKNPILLHVQILPPTEDGGDRLCILAAAVEGAALATQTTTLSELDAPTIMSLLTLLETHLEVARSQNELKTAKVKEEAQQKAAAAQEIKERAESTAKSLSSSASTDAKAQLSLFSS